jgi:hypothetical protein
LVLLLEVLLLEVLLSAAWEWALAEARARVRVRFPQWPLLLLFAGVEKAQDWVVVLLRECVWLGARSDLLR